MSGEALYQKYRSQTFDEVIGQDYVVRSIKNAIRQNKVGHAYLFCGPRGTGKTTMARLLARAINCEHPDRAPCGECENCRAAIAGTHPDIIEINAANETHVEDIRDLIDRARLAPMMGKHKVYIIDEVHQLSSSASSALLKTLEEPPEHVIFILATTDPQKLLKTIISRCQRFDFSKVDTELIKKHLLDIAGKEGFELEEGAAEKIAQLADGGMRDALSILEQAVAYADNHVTEQSINEIFGLASNEEKIAFLDDIFQKNLESVLKRIRNCEEHGIDLRRLTQDLADDLKDGIIWNYTKNESLLRAVNKEQAEHIGSLASDSRLLDMVKILSDVQLKYAKVQSVPQTFEIACLELMSEKKREEQPEAEITVSQKEPVHQTVQTQPQIQIQPEVQPTEENDSVQDEEPAEPVQINVLNETQIVSILAGCDKNSKAEDESRLKQLESTPPIDRYKAALQQVTLAASGRDYILFVAKSDAVRDHLMEEQFNRGFYEYLRNNGIDKMPYAVDMTSCQSAVEMFRKLMNEKNLPAAFVCQKWTEESKTTEENDPAKKIQKIFGAENVQII